MFEWLKKNKGKDKMAIDSQRDNSMDNNNVYITTLLKAETTINLIKTLSRWVMTKSSPKQPEQKTYNKTNDYKNKYSTKPGAQKDNKPEIIQKNNKIFMPYEKWPEDKPVLNIYISSSGGDVYVLEELLTLLHMAQAHGTIIRTFTLSRAASACSILAISGTEDYRYMSEDAYHYIHYGCAGAIAEREDEIEFKIKNITEHSKFLQKHYLQRTDLTQKELNKFYKTEGSGQLNAIECLKKGLCDCIITNCGRYIHSNPLVQQEINKFYNNNITDSIQQNKCFQNAVGDCVIKEFADYLQQNNLSH